MLAITIGPSTAALAQTDVPTSAVVSTGAGGSGAGVAPNIECKWELPDVDSSVTGIQYGPDDSSAGPTLANGSTATTPCVNGPAGRPVQADGLRHMIQVNPNPHDQPEQRRIETWVAIDPPTDGSGISTAFDAVAWNIYHPDGTLKIEIYGTWVAGGTNSIGGTIVNKRDLCASVLGSSGAATGTMLGAAQSTGQVSSGAAGSLTDGVSLRYWCTQSKQFWRSEFKLSKHQPCGEYRVVVTVKNSLGATKSLTNYFDVNCVQILELDFDSVDFGAITAGFGKIIDGNVIWERPPGGAAPPIGPTVRNNGNSGMSVRVTFSDMCVGYNPATNSCPTGVDRISSFDACLAVATAYNSSGNGTATPAPNCKDPIASNTPTSLSDGTIRTTLCANRLAKLDLSIHPQSGIAAGAYTGKLTVASVAVPGICLTDLGHADTTSVSGANDPAYPGQPVGTGAGTPA
jgi:hypothetical protein